MRHFSRMKSIELRIVRSLREMYASITCLQELFTNNYLGDLLLLPREPSIDLESLHIHEINKLFERKS